MSGAGGLDVAIRHPIRGGPTLDVTLAVGAELAMLTGPSGAGKTTLLRLIAGLELPAAGTIRAGDVVLTDRARGIRVELRRRQVGYAFQHDVLFPHLDVAGNLGYGLRGRPAAAARARVAEVGELFGIGPLLRRRVATLSGGERQRVGLARAVAPRPRVLLCDEPVSALDHEARYQLLARLKAVQAVEAIPVLLVTHAWDEALAFGDRLHLMEAGRIVAAGDPAAVFAERSRQNLFDGSRWRNVFAGVVAGHDHPGGSSTIQLAGGPMLTVAGTGRPIGARVLVRVGGDEIILARGPIGLISARNLLAGTIERVDARATTAEVVVRVGTTTWVVGIIEATIRALDLAAGDEVRLIVKARSCRLFPAGSSG